MTDEMPKPYRGITSDGKSYYIGEKVFPFKLVSGKQLVSWRKLMEKMEKEETGLKFQGVEAQIAQDILEKGLEGFNFDNMLEDHHPKELTGSAGDVYAFLYETGTPRERELLLTRSRLEESQMKKQ
jgi:hypothetical protein